MRRGGFVENICLIPEEQEKPSGKLKDPWLKSRGAPFNFTPNTTIFSTVSVTVVPYLENHI